MVRTAQLNSLGFTEFLLRIRPGVAISVVLHVGLILFLAYVLAFPPGDPTMESDEPIIQVIQSPVVVPPKIQREEIKHPLFRPKPMKQLENVRIDVPPLVLPPVETTPDRRPTAVTAPPSPQVIDDPRPISRGGLFYPERAVEHNITGYVDFSFMIEPDGSVGDPQIIDEAPGGYGLAAAALKAFRTWRFEPKRVDGIAVAAPARYRISFQLQ